MRDLNDVMSEALQWVRPKRSKRAFELRAGEAVVATLVWTRGSSALAQWAQGQYRFSRQGWLRQRILVHGASSTTPVATDEPLATFAQRAGALTFPDGRAFLWRKPQRWTSERVWVDSNATALVRFRSVGHAAVAVICQPEAVSLPELPLLLLLGQYLLVLASQDAEAASTAAVVAVIASS